MLKDKVFKKVGLALGLFLMFGYSEGKGSVSCPTNSFSGLSIGFGVGAEFNKYKAEFDGYEDYGLGKYIDLGEDGGDIVEDGTTAFFFDQPDGGYEARVQALVHAYNNAVALMDDDGMAEALRKLNSFWAGYSKLTESYLGRFSRIKEYLLGNIDNIEINRFSPSNRVEIDSIGNIAGSIYQVDKDGTPVVMFKDGPVRVLDTSDGEYGLLHRSNMKVSSNATKFMGVAKLNLFKRLKRNFLVGLEVAIELGDHSKNVNGTCRGAPLNLNKDFVNALSWNFGYRNGLSESSKDIETNYDPVIESYVNGSYYVSDGGVLRFRSAKYDKIEEDFREDALKHISALRDPDSDLNKNVLILGRYVTLTPDMTDEQKEQYKEMVVKATGVSADSLIERSAIDEEKPWLFRDGDEFSLRYKKSFVTPSIALVLGKVFKNKFFFGIRGGAILQKGKIESLKRNGMLLNGDASSNFSSTDPFVGIQLMRNINRRSNFFLSADYVFGRSKKVRNSDVGDMKFSNKKYRVSAGINIKLGKRRSR